MVLKFIRREGVGEVVPQYAEVSVKYIGYFEHQDEPFDSSYARRSGLDVLCLGKGLVIPGLEMGLRSMRRHEISLFLIKPEYAYGAMGCLPRIPPNEEVLFVVYLKDFSENISADTYEATQGNERKLFCNAHKRALNVIAIGFENFKSGKTKQAIREYTKVVNWLEEAHLANDEEEDEQKKLLTRAYGNLAVCYNKENRPRSACVACNKIPTPNAKSHFNHGRALIRLGEFERAKDELWLAKKMESKYRDKPKYTEIDNELELAEKMRIKYNAIIARLLSNRMQVEIEEIEFIEAARELCRNFKLDVNLVKQNLPKGLSPEEDKCIRRIAAEYELSVTNQTRFDEVTIFLNKPNY